MAKERMITAREVAAYLSCSVSTVRRLAKRNKIPHYRLGKLVRFRRGEVDGWLASIHRGELTGEGEALVEAQDQLSLFDPAPFVPPSQASA